MDQELSYRLNSEASRRRLLRPLLAMLLIAIAGLLGTIAAVWNLPPAAAVLSCLLILAATVLPLLAIGAWCVFGRNTKIQEAACALDSKANAKNRMEAFIELEPTANPLKKAQAQDALSCYSRQPKPRWWMALAGLLLLIVFLSISELGVTVFSPFLAKAAEGLRIEGEALERKPEQKTAQESEAKPKPLDTASLEIVSPEPESRAKPIDEVTWQASARSNNGFESFSLELAVNGERKVSMPVDGAPLKAPEEQSVEGAIDLSELKVAPFDLVSYHLKGTALLNGKLVEICSLPQFIEIRPFREDARLQASSFDPALQKLLESILSFLRSELILNKALYAARNSGLSQEEKALREQVAILAKEQSKLGQELERFIKEADPEKLTANEFECLSRCVGNMRDAAQRLGAPTLPTAKNDSKGAAK